MGNGRYRWYDIGGQVYADLTIEEGISRNLFPSVTTVIDIIYRRELEAWKYKQIATAAREVSQEEYKNENAWFWAVLYRADLKAREARNHGLEVHKDERIRKMIEAKIRARRGECSIKWEVPVVNIIEEYGGTVDAIAETREGVEIIELKTQSREKPIFYEEWFLQVGGYAEVLDARAAEIIIISTSGKVAATKNIDGIELDEARRAFLALREVWRWYERMWRRRIAATPVGGG